MSERAASDDGGEERDVWLRKRLEWIESLRTFLPHKRSCRTAANTHQTTDPLTHTQDIYFYTFM